MIRGLGMARREWIMLTLSRKQAPRAARAGTFYVDIGFGALEPGGAGLILGFARAICRVPGLCRKIGQTIAEPAGSGRFAK